MWMASRRTFNLARSRRIVHAGPAFRVRLAALPALLAVASGPEIAPAAQAESCAVWVVRNALETRDAWRAALDAVERIGCRAIYLQVSGRWDAYFPSVVFVPPATPPRGGDWADDPFGRALVEARGRGIEVHAWVNALLAWSAESPPGDPDHVFRRHPEWFVRGPRGSMRAMSRASLDAAGLAGEGWFLDPARADVRTELRRFVLELVTRYPVDGVHLDYIRYPTGWAPPGGDAAVGLLVGLIRDDLRAIRPGIVLSAAVLPRPEESRRSFAQDWAAWLERGLIDEVVPMVYRETPAAVEREVAGYPPELPRERIRVGVRIDRLDPGEVAETVRRLDARGASGVAIFSHNLLLEGAWRRAGPVVSR